METMTLHNYTWSYTQHDIHFDYPIDLVRENNVHQPIEACQSNPDQIEVSISCYA